MRYDRTTLILHWLTFFVILFMLVLGYTMGDVKKSLASQLYLLHKSVGLCLLALIIFRIIWACIHKHPAYPNTMSTIEKKLASTMRYVLYTLLLLMPLSGWIFSTASGHTPSLFNLFLLPAPVPLNATLATVFHTIHNTAAWLLIVFILIHTLAALKHHYWDNDDILRRMLP